MDERNATGKRALADRFCSLSPFLPPAVRKFIDFAVKVHADGLQRLIARIAVPIRMPWAATY